MLEIKSLNDDLDERNSAKSGGKVADSAAGDISQAGLHSGRLVITQLTSGVRDSNRVNVYVNGKFALSLDMRQVVDLQVKVGKAISKEELQQLHSASEFGKLYQRALEWVLMRPRSVWETRDYLKRRQLKRVQLNKKRLHDELKPLPEIQDASVNLVMDRLVERGYVDDRKFTEFYVENRFVKKGVSRRRLEMELHKKHVDDTIIREVLANSGRSDDEELMKMIAKKRGKYDAPKLIQYLVRQGFDYQKSKDAVEQLDNEND